MKKKQAPKAFRAKVVGVQENPDRFGNWLSSHVQRALGALIILAGIGTILLFLSLIPSVFQQATFSFDSTNLAGFAPLDVVFFVLALASGVSLVYFGYCLVRHNWGRYTRESIGVASLFLSSIFFAQGLAQVIPYYYPTASIVQVTPPDITSFIYIVVGLLFLWVAVEQFFDREY